MITKTADAILHDYQQRVLGKLRDEKIPGLIAYHSTGSGKTLTALKALQEAKERTGKPGLFIVPASLVSNAKKEWQNHSIPLTDNDLQVMSYEKAMRGLPELLKKDYGLIAFDEAHKLRNSGTDRVLKLKGLMRQADKNLLLTGTAGYNNPADVGILAKLVNPSLKVPQTPQEFEQQYVDSNTGLLKNKAALRKTLAPYVDIYERPQDAADFP